jgi:signal transduction histidine kinase
VDVEVGRAEEWARLTVADTGPGIPPHERERVFDRFYRLSSTDVPGSGLGFAIVRAIVRQHGGQIRLLDTAGGGLTVQVDLPLDDVAAG